MIQKALVTPSPSLRRQSGRTQMASPNYTNVPQSPTVRSTSSFSNLRRNPTRRSNSITSNSSGTPSRSTPSSRSETFLTPHHLKLKQSRSASSSSSMSNDPYTGTITVAIRIKPIVSQENLLWKAYPHSGNKITHHELGDFKFDHVFGPDRTNLDVFHSTCVPLIDNLFNEFNVTLFAYGMTGSGKTYTMMGEDTIDGLVGLCGSALFTKALLEGGIDCDKKYEVLVSYLEIYNERVYDLLDSSNGNNELKIRDDSTYGVRVVGLTEKRCDDTNELMKWVKKGDMSRKTGKTDYNTRSSRSHAIILIRLISTNLATGATSSNTLSLCDLAGSERAAVQQERRKEGAFINKSLLALGTVISKLSAESGHATSPGSSGSSFGSNHIPYRDSKLTRILQPALSGDSIVTTICTIDPRNESSTETINTLRFASRAKNVSLNITKKTNISNRVDEEKDNKIRELRRQLEEQEQLIYELKQNATNHQPDTDPLDNPNSVLLQTENSILKNKLLHYEKLIDKDTLDLENNELVEIVELLPPEVGMLLETKIQGLQSQIREYKKYTLELEEKLAYVNQNKQSINHIDDNNCISSADKEKIEELQKMLDRKDMMINALQSAKRIRERAFKPIDNELNTSLTLTNK